MLHAGIEIHPYGEPQPFQMKVALVGCCCDLPARAVVLNTIQFNGWYGCNYCEQPGRSLSTSKGGHVHIFPFIADLPKRTKETWKEHATKASTQSSPV